MTHQKSINNTKDRNDLYMVNFDKEKALAVWPEGILSPRERSLCGEKYGKWTVMYPTEKIKNNRKYVCHCDCGTVRPVNAGSLRADRTHSCGCVVQNHSTPKLQPGMEWNGIKIIKDTGKRTSKGEIIFECQDSDGVIFEQKSTNIKHGTTKSAGLSKGELLIYNLLVANGYSVKTHKRVQLDTFIGTYDIVVNDQYFIEYDGEQHFINIEGLDYNFEYTRSHDLEKNKYCFENNIPLIRIPYYVNIQLEDLLLETSKYIFTQEREKEYYATY